MYGWANYPSRRNWQPRLELNAQPRLGLNGQPRLGLNEQPRLGLSCKPMLDSSSTTKTRYKLEKPVPHYIT